MMIPDVAEPGSPVGAALAREERAGIRVAATVRIAALAVIALWVATRAAGAAKYYYLAVVAAFALLGLAQVLLSRRGTRRAWLASYALAAIDMVVLTVMLVVPNPLVPPDWPVAMQLRLGNFDFFYLFIAFAVLGLAPGLALWVGIAAATAWSVGVLWVLGQPGSFTVAGSRLLENMDLARLKDVLLHPDYVSLEVWVQQTLVALLVAGILALAVRRARRLVFDQAKLARERANLARYFSPRRAEELAQSVAALGSERQQSVAVLFVDIVGFTRMCESLDPTAVIALLREFHRRMAITVFALGGTLEKYIGDAVMATFGTPDTAPDDALRAIRCGRAMMNAVDSWNGVREAEGYPRIEIGIGAQYGNVVLGDVGDQRCMEFAVIGDTVNVASHLEKLCRQHHAIMAIGAELYTEASKAATATDLAGFQEIAPQILKTREDPLGVKILLRQSRTLTRSH